ncbi:MAG: porin [Methylibium sp.]
MHRLSCYASAALTAVVSASLLSAAPAAQAQASSQLTIAGTLDLALRQVKNGTLGTVRSEASGSNLTSKLIVRGREDLGDGLYASFFLDATILADTGTANATFWDRRSTVELGHQRYGELRLGRDWVPTHLLWSGFDPFTTLGIASANTFRNVFVSRALGQAFGASAAAAAANPTLRVNNVVEYFLPRDLGGIYGALMVSAGEGGTAGTGATRGEGGRLGWSSKTIDVALAHYKTRNANADQSFTDRAWGASYDFGPARLSLAQRRWSHTSDKTTNTLLGVQIPVGLGTIKLSYVRADQGGATAAFDANDASLWGAGYVHNLSKRTALYGHMARVSNRASAAFSIPGGAATSGLSTAANYFGGQTSTGFEFGVRHNF